MAFNRDIETIDTKYRRIISLGDDEYINGKKVTPFLNNFNLVIPAYQRPYSWTKKNVEQLLQDLLQQVKFFSEEDYFLGMIFTIERMSNDDDKTYEIVDGQQRLTTIVILLTYFKLIYKDKFLRDKKQWKDVISTIDNISLVSESEKDRIILEQITKAETLDELFKMLKNGRKIAVDQEDKFFAQQWGIFKTAFGRIKKFFEKEEAKKYQFDVFSYLFSRVKVLHIVSRPDALIGDQFFSSLNGKGLKLDQVDLLKSTFIHPYITCDKNSSTAKNNIKKFKTLWGELISDTENEMLKKITDYFVASTKEKNKITPSTLNDSICNKWLDDQRIKSEFENMCKFFKNNAAILKSKTSNQKVNFLVKLNKFFKFDSYYKVLFLSILNTKDFDVTNSKDLTRVSNILESLFKINLIYLKLGLGKTPTQFIGDVINNKVFGQEDNDVANVEDALNTLLKNIISGEDPNIGENFRNYRFNYNKLCYDKPSTNNYKITFLLNLIYEAYSPDIKDLEYEKAIQFVRYNIDHRVQKTCKKSTFTENGKRLEPWKLKNDNQKKKIFFQHNYFDVFADKEFNEKYKIFEFGTLYEDFDYMLNKPFNLRLMPPSDNKKKSSHSSMTKDELKNHFTIKNEINNKINLTKAWNWFINGKFEYSEINTCSYITVWRIIENYLKDKLIEFGVVTDTELFDMQSEKYFLSKILQLSFDSQIIKTRDDLNVCKHVLFYRNKIHTNNLEADKVIPEWQPLVDKFLNTYNLI